MRGKKRAVRFEIEGLFNSFRKDFMKKFQSTFLSPPKNTILGLICNCMGRGEEFLYGDLQESEIAIVPLTLEGIFRDLWIIKKLKPANRGKEPLSREKLFLARYMIYISPPNRDLYEEIRYSLTFPMAVPSLGMDDEIINIFKNSVEIMDLIPEKAKVVDSILRYREGFSCKIDEKDEITFYPRIENKVCKFSRKEKYRKIEDRKELIEFFNCKVVLKKKEIFYRDKENNFTVEFF